MSAKLFRQTVLLACLTVTFTDDLTADVDPELILQELGDGDVNCTVANAVGQVEYRWTRLSHPEWDHVYTQVLEFSQVSLDQAGVYVCEVRDTVTGKTTSDSMELIIHYVPRWNNDYAKKAAAYTGTAVDIKCVVLSLPTPQFYWMRNGLNITTSAEYVVTSEGNTSTLRVNNVEDTNYGDFICRADNYVGGRNFNIHFSPPGIPDSPRECFAVNVTDRGAIMECAKGWDGGEPTTFAFTGVEETTMGAADQSEVRIRVDECQRRLGHST
ncbi:hypothetical protein LSH36_170g02013 [Paralvinella palmiformis]|uniref:Ig-like domain-containing protein n=1 Tax=Paralvinella palmiformis TaxID=53620 RepID=A0AAD9JSK1_9ANNE|nr:hypothetical protein LSH36_170g02013 [Paralvinella palmiformis]